MVCLFFLIKIQIVEPVTVTFRTLYIFKNKIGTGTEILIYNCYPKRNSKKLKCSSPRFSVLHIASN